MQDANFHEARDAANNADPTPRTPAATATANTDTSCRQANRNPTHPLIKQAEKIETLNQPEIGLK
jgi:hypothetical protein